MLIAASTNPFVQHLPHLAFVVVGVIAYFWVGFRHRGEGSRETRAVASGGVAPRRVRAGCRSPGSGSARAADRRRCHRRGPVRPRRRPRPRRRRCDLEPRRLLDPRDAAGRLQAQGSRRRAPSLGDHGSASRRRAVARARRAARAAADHRGRAPDRPQHRLVHGLPAPRRRRLVDGDARVAPVAVHGAGGAQRGGAGGRFAACVSRRSPPRRSSDVDPVPRGLSAVRGGATTQANSLSTDSGGSGR